MLLTPDIIVVGGGLAGLTCARTLHSAGLETFVCEGADAIGGRIRTDQMDGFLMDRGFQVLQTAYPEARQALDLSALNLKPFDPGVAIYRHRKFHILADPIRAPRYLLSTLISPICTTFDAFRMLRLYLQTTRRSLESIFEQGEVSTHRYLRAFGFSNDMIQTFFRPFFAGVCLDPDIRASSRVFEYVFQMFARGDAAIPENGMAEIPRQIASDLPAASIGTNMRVAALSRNGVVLADGRELSAPTVVLATEAREVQRLLGKKETINYCSEFCLYFAADQPPFPHRLLVLNGEGQGPINNLAVLSQVSARYAPAGQTLMAAVVIGDAGRAADQLKQAVKSQLREWFGPCVNKWRHLRTYRIQRALPVQQPPTANPFKSPCRIRKHIYVCGEYANLSAIQWALYSGRQTAAAILHDKGLTVK